MPKEVIAGGDGDQHLVVSWTKRDSLDPMIAVGSWKKWEDPNGTSGEWRPDGPQWALSREAADHMIIALRRARDQVHNQASAPAPNITINFRGPLLDDPKELAAQVQAELLRIGMRGRAYGLGEV